jgi:CBS domain containing-hemolysin-like protein
VTPLLLLAVALILIAMCGIFVAAEFAFVTVDRGQVERLAAEGDASAQGLLNGLRSLSTQLSGAQVGITVTNLGVGFLAEPAIADLIDGPLRALGMPDGVVRPLAIGIGLVVGTVLTMIFGELVPKNLAIALPLATARATRRSTTTRSGSSTARPTPWSADWAWSRRRSCAPPGAPRSSPR